MKRVISLMIIITVFMIGFVYAESGDNEYNNGYEAGYRAGYQEGSSEVYRPTVPKLVLTNKETLEAVPGEYLDIKLDFKNSSEYTAHNIKITPIYEGSILEYEGPQVYESDKSLRREKEGTATFSLKVKPNIKAGVYELKFQMDYTNLSKENYSSVGIVYAKVSKDRPKARLSLENGKTDPEQVVAGEVFDLSFDINNIGELEAKEIYVRLTKMAEDTFMPLNSKDLIYIDQIDGNGTYKARFRMIASEDIKKGNHTLGVTVNYLDSNKEEVTTEKTFYLLNVKNEKEEEPTPTPTPDAKPNKPKIMIDSYATNPKAIVAGDKIDFSFSFRNTNSTKTIKNMKITISSEGPFIISQGSNTFYIDRIGPRASISKSIALNVKQDLTSNSYPVKINFDYEDEEGNNYVADEIINLPVTEFSRLVINSANVYECIAGQQTSLSFDYINMGKATISNLTASVEGDFTAVQAINYIGNLEAGNSDYYDIMVVPSKAGELSGTLVLTFEDSSGKKIEERKVFTTTAMAAFEPGEFDYPQGEMYPTIEDNTETAKVYQWWQFVLFGFLGFVVSFIITKIITSKIIQKKLEDEI